VSHFKGKEVRDRGRTRLFYGILLAVVRTSQAQLAAFNTITTGRKKMGLGPIPHFILCLDTKNEARKVKTKRLLPALPQSRNF